MLLALICFFLTYCLMLFLPNRRAAVALTGACVMMILSYITPSQALAAVDWNIILMLTGTMGIVELFIQSRMPARISEVLLTLVPNACWAVIILSVFSGLISAFVDNVATVLMLAPIGLAVSKKLRYFPGSSRHCHCRLLQSTGRSHIGGRHHLHPAWQLWPLGLL